MSRNSDQHLITTSTPAAPTSAGVVTPGRVFSNTSWLQFGDSSWSRLTKMVVLSLIVHALLSPGPALLGLVKMLPALEIPEPARLIEVELTALPVAAPAVEPDAEKEKTLAEPMPDAAPPETPEPEAKAPAAAKAETTPEPTPEPTSPTKSEETEPPLVKSTPFADPVALAGEAGAIVDSNANLRLSIFADVIRDQPLGAKVGQLLRRTPQWRDFFGPSAIDPIQDVDRVLLAGPDFRDSSQVVAVVQHRMTKERIDGAFDTLVRRKGEWIDREKHLARASADRAPRIFAAPNDHVVVVAPPQLEAQVRELGAKTKFPRTDGLVALSAYIIKPHYAAKGTGIVLPKSIKWARLDLRPGADGGGVLHILAEDSGNKQAKEHAALLEALVDQITSVDLSKGGAWGGVASLLMGTKKVKMIQSVEFSADGKKIRGKLVATKNQLLNLADLLAALLPPMPEEQAQNGPLNPSGPNASEPSLDQASPEQELPAASPAADPLEDRSPTPDLPAEEARIPESAPQTPPEPEQDPEPKESNPPRSSER